jgi:hypothetical protein
VYNAAGGWASTPKLQRVPRRAPAPYRAAGSPPPDRDFSLPAPVP